MTLTVIVGPSGSGKTTFMEDVAKLHPCVYTRQYHMIRPYILVKDIPNFDPTVLPYWETYEKEGTASQKRVGGSRRQTLDEPFSGVTDGFVPFIQDRLEKLRENHNVLLVSNDHVELLKDMANHTITVSSIDRSVVKLNDQEGVDREKIILALASVGKNYSYSSKDAGIKFFMDVEILSNSNLRQIFFFAIFAFAFYIATFWDSARTSAPLVLIAGGIVAFFSLQPFLLSQVEWRNSMLEETEVLVHSSPHLNSLLKLLLTLTLIFILTAAEFGVVNVVTSGMFNSAKYWVAMLCDSASLTLPLVCRGIYTRLPFQTVQIVGSAPFLGMLFLSTTFSPGAGLPVLKELRYIYPRFYFWCMVPGVQEGMEGCPSEDSIVLYLILSTLTGVFIFFSIMFVVGLKKKLQRQKIEGERESLKKGEEYEDLEQQLFGKDVEQGGGSHDTIEGRSESMSSSPDSAQRDPTV